MPIYAYRCASCGHQFDLRQSFSDDPTASCPKCGSSAQRVIQPVGIVFKGSGWHVTDYRSSNSGRGGGKSTGDSGESGGDSGSSATGSEPAKPAAAGSSTES